MKDKKKNLFFFVLFVVILLLVFRKNKQSDTSYSPTSNMSINSPQGESGANAGTSGFIKSVTGESVVTSDEFDLSSYEKISYNDFVNYIKDHYDLKRGANFKGISVFRESYRFFIDLPYEPVSISPGMKDTLVDALGDEQIARMFTHTMTINIDGINFYYFIQEKLADDIIDNWGENNSYEIFVYIPFTNHFSDYVPILVNATNDQSNSSYESLSMPKIKIADPNEKSYCYVDKNGSFEMTSQECQELADSMGNEFRWKAFQYCLDGKNPEIGDSGTAEDREQVCMDMFGYYKE